MKDQTRFRRISIICFVVMLVMFVIHVQILVTFNQQELNVHGNDSSQNAYMEIDSRNNTTSRWEKRDFPLTEDETVNLIGQTIDQTLYNNSGDMIRDWSLRINIAGDCFINQCWTGEVEIHQAAENGEDTVQRLNLQDYVLEDVKLQYRYDGDLLIPLQKGDYVVYYPNEHNNEMPVRSGDKLTIGMIFYHLDELDLSDYNLTVHFHRSFTQGWSFIAFMVTVGLWIIASVVHGTSVYLFRNERKQMELRRSGLSYMSELYEAIYIVNLPTGEVSTVSPGAYIEELREKYTGAKELLYNAVLNDADEHYLDAALAFVDTDTMAERLKGRKSLVYEFISKVYGWCRFLLFSMEAGEDKPVENVIFAVQDVNDERNITKSLTDRLKKAESATTAGNAFLSGAARDLQAPVTQILEADEQILRESDPEKIREEAEKARITASRILTLIDGLVHRAEAVRGTGEAVSEPYSLMKIASEALELVRPLADEKQIRLATEISGSVPEMLLGDPAKLKEAMASLLANAVNHSADGTVLLSAFAKGGKDAVHLLVSVRALPENEDPSAPPPEVRRIRTVPDLDLEVAGSLLTFLGSELKSVNTADAWKDMYFEIDQQTVPGRSAGEEKER